MRLIFIATGDIALPSFRHLLEHGPRPLALVTQPDKPVGRHQTLTPPRIKTEALAAGIPVLQPEKISSAVEEMKAFAPEVIVVMAYGQILRKDVLEMAENAIINLHASLLPRHRGAACIQAAIDMGDEETGITSMHVVKALDAGDMIVKRSIPILPDETGGILHDRLADLAAEVLAETLQVLQDGTAPRVPQDDALSNYVSKLEREDGCIDWSVDATAIARRIRAYDPWPGTYTQVLEDGKWKRLKIFPPTEVLETDLPAGTVSTEDGLVIGCGKGSLRLTHIQPEGAKRMTAGDYLRGRKPEMVGEA